VNPQAFGRLPWLAALFLRERRLRPPLPIAVSSKSTRFAPSGARAHSARVRP